MRNAVVKLLMVALVALGTLTATDAQACGQCDGGHGMSGGGGGGGYGYGYSYGYSYGYAMGGRPMWYGRRGRFPKMGFRAPVRRSFGLPGFTPVRQFTSGRGQFRRINRRMARRFGW